MVYVLGEQLKEIEKAEALASGKHAVFITNSKKCREVLEEVGILFEGDIELESVSFCKVETQQDCIYGSLAIPKLLDVLGRRVESKINSCRFEKSF